MKTEICIKILFMFLFGYARGVSPQCQNAPINDPKYEKTLFRFLFPNDQRLRSDRERTAYIVEQLLCELPVNSRFAYSFGYFIENYGPISNIDRTFSNRIQNYYPAFNESRLYLCNQLGFGLNKFKEDEPTTILQSDSINLIYLFPATDYCSIYRHFKNRDFHKNYKFFAIRFDNTRSDDYITLNIQHLRNFDIDQKIASPGLTRAVQKFARQILGLKEEEPPALHEQHWTDHLWAPLYILLYLIVNFVLAFGVIGIASLFTRRQ